jgi:hypothetical protein
MPTIGRPSGTNNATATYNNRIVSLPPSMTILDSPPLSPEAAGFFVRRNKRWRLQVGDHLTE